MFVSADVCRCRLTGLCVSQGLASVLVDLLSIFCRSYCDILFFCHLLGVSMQQNILRYLDHSFLSLSLGFFLLANLGCHDSFSVSISDEEPPSDEKIRIGLLLDGSHDEPELVEAAVRLAWDHHGPARVLDLVLRSTENTPEGAGRAALQLIHQEEVMALIGPTISQLAIAAGEVAEQAGVPLISPGSTNPKTTDGRSFIFRTTFVDTEQNQKLAKFAYDKLGLRRVAILYESADFYSRSNAETFRDNVLAVGGEVSLFIGYTPGMNPEGHLRRIYEDSADALYLANGDDDILPQARRIRALGFEGVLLGSDAWDPGLVTREPALEGAYLTLHWHLDQSQRRPEARRFIEAWRERTNRDPGALEALNYDAASLVAQGFRRPRVHAQPEKKQRAALRDFLAEIEGYPGATGDMTFRDRGGNPEKAVIVGQIRAGRLELVDVEIE